MKMVKQCLRKYAVGTGEHLFTISFGALAIRPTCHYFASSLSSISFGYLSVVILGVLYVFFFVTMLSTLINNSY